MGGAVRTSVQMVLLRAPDPPATARFYTTHLGYRPVTEDADEVILDGYGMQIVISRGQGDGLTEPPSREEAAVEVTVDMRRMEAVWDEDRKKNPRVLGPVLDGRGVFVYVTLDPAGNPVALVTALPRVTPDMPEGRVTKRLRRPDFD